MVDRIEGAEKRFWKFVDKKSDNECWNWLGGIKDTGRGNFYLDGKTIQAHRMSWLIHFGEIPDGLDVLHTCDNGKCVNPNHLFLGTQLDNIRDMESKGRAVHLRGDNDPKSKLTESQVKEIFFLYKPKEFSQFKLAKMFKVSRSTIEAVLHKKTWKHVVIEGVY